MPTKPFVNFKWQWASFQCTESLNDPIILLGVLSKMRKLEGHKKYSSPEFSAELLKLQNDVSDSLTVNLAGRGGERNIIRNSGQYWKALGLINDNSRGMIKLTPFGQRVADHEISQAEFAVTVIKTLTLPNPHIQKQEVCQEWQKHGISIQPLILILKILDGLFKRNSHEAYLTANELIKIIIPLSGANAEVDDYVNFILGNREGKIDLSIWPNCCTDANDKRITREFLLFLKNYGYVKSVEMANRYDVKYFMNYTLIDEIHEIDTIRIKPNLTLLDTLSKIRANDIVSDIERKRIIAYRIERPNQAKFRKNVLGSFMNRCILTNIAMPEVLEAAHIKPVQYNGNDSIANSLCMRLDMHQLFDTGHLRITVAGDVVLSQRAKLEYRSVIPDQIELPNFISREFLEWRWNNYNGI